MTSLAGISHSSFRGPGAFSDMAEGCSKRAFLAALLNMGSQGSCVRVCGGGGGGGGGYVCM